VVSRLESGEPLQQIADELFVSIETSAPFSRADETVPNVPQPAVAAAFEGPKGHVASVVVPGTGRVVLTVEEVVPPAFFEEAADLQALQAELSEAIGNSLLLDYVATLQRERGVTLNQPLIDQVVGAREGG
jgi:peptidyl-prolyl cis-trans isomerase D